MVPGEQQAEVKERAQGLSLNFHLPRSVVTPWLGHELCECTTTVWPVCSTGGLTVMAWGMLRRRVGLRCLQGTPSPGLVPPDIAWSYGVLMGGD